jgi:hypothetical protein
MFATRHRSRDVRLSAGIQPAILQRAAFFAMGGHQFWHRGTNPDAKDVLAYRQTVDKNWIRGNRWERDFLIFQASDFFWFECPEEVSKALGMMLLRL